MANDLEDLQPEIIFARSFSGCCRLQASRDERTRDGSDLVVRSWWSGAGAPTFVDLVPGDRLLVRGRKTQKQKEAMKTAKRNITNKCNLRSFSHATFCGCGLVAGWNRSGPDRGGKTPGKAAQTRSKPAKSDGTRQAADALKRTIFRANIVSQD